MRSRRLVYPFVVSLMLAGCGGGGSGMSGVMPTPAPTAPPTPVPTLVCTAQGAPQSIARSTVTDGLRRLPRRAADGFVPGKLAVVRSAARGEAIEVVSVPDGSELKEAARLRQMSGVRAVRRIAYRSALRTTAAFTNDPYLQGFAGANVPPLYENAGVPGQYDMHAICAPNAWGYANANTTGRTFAAAAGGNASVKIAILDTGADLTHPDLAGRVTYAESDLNGVTTVGLGSMHDNDGHGTNVAGIAGAAANNGIGFAGVAYNASLMIFKVFPDPPSGGCAPGSTNPQCQANTADIALAIQHAVAHGANVINMSLGASTPDATEENAVAAAISAGVVVVAASGNEGLSTLDYPAADPGVIAVGASSIDDSNPLQLAESVASYSNYSAANPTGWGVVAPGGDPSGTSDNDDLHWIENIYTSTAADSLTACKIDYGSSSGATDCRILDAGTSQAAPHVAGAAALLLSVGASPSNVRTILCSTANGIAGSHGGCGRLNVYRALAQVVGDASP